MERGKSFLVANDKNQAVLLYFTALKKAYEDLLHDSKELDQEGQKLLNELMKKLDIEENIEKLQQHDQKKNKPRDPMSAVNDEDIELNLILRDLLLNAKVIKFALMWFASIDNNQTMAPQLKGFVNKVLSMGQNMLHPHIKVNNDFDQSSRLFKALILKSLADLCVQQRDQAQMQARAQALYKAVLSLYPELTKADLVMQNAKVNLQNVDAKEQKVYAEAKNSLKELENSHPEVTNTDENQDPSLKELHEMLLDYPYHQTPKNNY